MPQGPGIAGRIKPEHRALFAVPLAPEHLATLVDASTKGLLRSAIPDDHAQALIAAGYATMGAGGLVVNDAGKVRAMIEAGL